jgi:hypothetical protein
MHRRGLPFLVGFVHLFMKNAPSLKKSRGMSRICWTWSDMVACLFESLETLQFLGGGLIWNADYVHHFAQDSTKLSKAAVGKVKIAKLISKYSRMNREY